MLRRPGYHLEPHLDPDRVVVTCLIYFARPGDDESFGTSFYRINGDPVINRRNTFFPRDEGYSCDLVKTAPFTPNTAVAFVNAGGAHGAGIPRSAPKGTERYAYQFLRESRACGAGCTRSVHRRECRVKAVRVHTLGGPEVLNYEDVEIPRPGPG
jgi:hypothetical protein